MVKKPPKILSCGFTKEETKIIICHLWCAHDHISMGLDYSFTVGECKFSFKSRHTVYPECVGLIALCYRRITGKKMITWE